MKSLNLNDVLPAPEIPTSLSKNAKWLSGEGCGSWFMIEPLEKNYLIKRFSPEGKLECSGEFIIANNIEFNINEYFNINYLSHCAEVNILQNDNNIQFKLIEK